MKNQEFNELIIKIENGNFTDTNLSISTRDDANDLCEDGVDVSKKENITLLVNALNQNPYITTLSLSYNNISDFGAIILANTNNIKELSVYSNHIGPIGIKALLTNTNLETLNLGANYLDWSRYSYLEIMQMHNSFINNKTLTSLSLESTYTYGIPEKVIAELIGKNTTIKHLNLSSNNFNCEVLKYIKNNTTLETLDLYQNNISNKGCEYLSQNSNLKTLILNHNKNITNVDARLLSNHPTLKELNLHGTMITIEGAKAFIGSNLEELDFHDYEISNKEYEEWHSKFESSKKAKRISLQEQGNFQESIETNVDNVSLTGNVEDNTSDDSYF